MKKSLLYLGVLSLAGALASCAPAHTAAPATATAPVTDADSATLVATQSGINRTYDFYTGTVPALNLRYNVTGDSIKLNGAQYCTVNGAAATCAIPTVLAGKNVLLPVQGTNLCVTVLYKRTLDGEDHTRKAC